MTTYNLAEKAKDFAEDYAERLANAKFTEEEAFSVYDGICRLFEKDHRVKLEGILRGYFKTCFWRKFKEEKVNPYEVIRRLQEK